VRSHRVVSVLAAAALLATTVGAVDADEPLVLDATPEPRVWTSVLPEPEFPPERDRLPTSPETRAAFEQRYPEQAEARRGHGPGENDWALLIGINEHLGAVANNHASRQDAERLHELLLEAGWSDERIVVMTDTDATGDMIREGLSWLARKAGDDATVLLNYSGHSKKWYGGGGAILDIGLWPTDDDFIRRDELGHALDAIPHARLWGNFATCNAEALHEADLGSQGRVLTYSSRTPEKSYEDPAAGHSVWGSFLLDDGLWTAAGGVAVQDAFEAAAPRATERTVGQRYGPQTPVIYDDLGEPFTLDID
jgi:hypothetical protein